MEDYFKILRRYNFWDSASIQVGLHRSSYQQRIIEYIGNDLIKVLVGQRRSGKSYILRQIIQYLIEKGVDAHSIFYINREYIAFDFLKDYKDLHKLYQLYKDKINPKGRIYLFIDEIQNIEGWERFANSMSQDFTEDCEVFITGSNSKMLSGELATLLSGRYINFEILPFSYQEFLKATEKIRSKQSYLNYMETGGLPELFHLESEEARRNYVLSVTDTVLLRDIIQRYPIKDAKLLEDLFIYLVNNASNLISINNIVNYMRSHQRKTSYDTVANYIGYIEDTFMIHRTKRYNISGKEVISGTYKYYVNDLSYKNYLYAGFSYGLGYQLENLIYLDLRRNAFDVHIGSIQNKEVDFVAQKGDRVLYIQVCYLMADKNTAMREYRPLEMIRDNYEKYVVSLDDIQNPSNSGIVHTQAWEFDSVLKSKI